MSGTIPAFIESLRACSDPTKRRAADVIEELSANLADGSIDAENNKNRAIEFEEALCDIARMLGHNPEGWCTADIMDKVREHFSYAVKSRDVMTNVEDELRRVARKLREDGYSWSADILGVQADTLSTARREGPEGEVERPGVVLCAECHHDKGCHRKADDACPTFGSEPGYHPTKKWEDPRQPGCVHEIRIVPDGALVDMPNGERMYALGPCAEEEEDGPPTITTFEVRAWLAPATSEPGERPQIERLIAHLDEIERGARCVHQVGLHQAMRSAAMSLKALEPDDPPLDNGPRKGGEHMALIDVRWLHGLGDDLLRELGSHAIGPQEKTWKCPAQERGCTERVKCERNGWCAVAGSIERIEFHSRRNPEC